MIFLSWILAAWLVVGSWGLRAGHQWKGYSPSCELQCREVGEPCDIGKEKVCCSHNNCKSFYGLTDCEAPVLSFTCDPTPQDDLIKQVIDPKLYPNLYNKP